MHDWMTSFNRKKHQRRINKYVRAMNKNIASDDLWRGRFVTRQVGSPTFYTYEDGSGAELENVHLVIIDLKDGHEVHAWDSGNGWCHWGGGHIWRFANYAITECFDVWHVTNNEFVSKCDPRDLKNDPNYDFNDPKVRKMWKETWPEQPKIDYARGNF